MFATKIKIGILLVIILGVGACVPISAEIATIAPSRIPTIPTTIYEVDEVVTATAVAATQTAILPTVTLTSIPNKIETPELAPTRRPTNTPRPTFTATPDHYVLPAWVTDPAINVLLAGIEERYNPRFSLFNADTGERFDLPVNISGHTVLSAQWKIVEEGIFIQLSHAIPAGSQSGLIEEINLQTGEVEKYEESHFYTDGELRSSSPNGRYTAQVIFDENKPPFMSILDEESKLEIELTGNFNSYYSNGITLGWSPDSMMLAVLSRHRSEDFDDLPEYALSVYTFKGELIQEHEGYFSHLRWSPTFPHQLLATPFDDFQTPCILNFVEIVPVCVERIVDWRNNQGVKTHQFSWSPDGKKIGFLYWNNETMNNGLCYLNLENDEVFCPITSEKLNGEYVILHDWSPDGRYLVVDMNPWGPDSHDGTFTSLAIVSSDGRTFHQLGSTAYVKAWRPAILVSVEE